MCVLCGDVSHFVSGWGWCIKVGKIAPIPGDGATCIVYGQRCIIDNVCSKLVGGCRKGGYGCRDGNGHPPPFAGNPQFEAILQNMENDCG